MKLYFEGSQTIVQDDNKEIKLEYYLVEEENDERNNNAYGIKVVQCCKESDCYEYTEPLSYDREIIETMVHTLKDNTVTATTMLDVIEDLVSQLL